MFFRSTLSRTILMSVLMCACFSFGQTQPTSTPQPGTGIEGVITVGPTHGGPTRVGVPDSKPLANRTFVVENEKGAVASFATDDQGRFRISLAPGHYTVSPKEKRPKIGRYDQFVVDYVACKMHIVAGSFDSER